MENQNAVEVNGEEVLNTEDSIMADQMFTEQDIQVRIDAMDKANYIELRSLIKSVEKELSTFHAIRGSAKQLLEMNDMKNRMEEIEKEISMNDQIELESKIAEEYQMFISAKNFLKYYDNNTEAMQKVIDYGNSRLETAFPEKKTTTFMFNSMIEMLDHTLEKRLAATPDTSNKKLYQAMVDVYKNPIDTTRLCEVAKARKQNILRYRRDMKKDPNYEQNFHNRICKMLIGKFTKDQVMALMEYIDDLYKNEMALQDFMYIVSAVYEAGVNKDIVTWDRINCQRIDILISMICDIKTGLFDLDKEALDNSLFDVASALGYAIAK